MLVKDSLLSEKEQIFLQSGRYKDDLPHLEQTLSEPRFKISDLGVTARDATYWDEKEILPPLKGKGMRRKYDLSQAIWILLIKQFRSLGVAIKTIKSIKDKLFNTKISIKEIVANPKALETLRTIANKEGYLKELEDLLNTGKLDSDIDLGNMFEFWVRSIVVLRQPLSLLLFADGQVAPYSLERHQELIEIEPNLRIALNQPYIKVSILEAYKEIVRDWSEKDFFNEISVVTEDEKKLLSLVRQSNLKSIELSFKDDSIDLIKVCKEQDVSIAHRVKDLISSHGYHDIIIKTRNGKPVYFENRILKKLEDLK